MKRWLLLGLLMGCGTVTNNAAPDAGSDAAADAADGFSVGTPAATTFVRVASSASIPVTLTRGGVTGEVNVTATTTASGVSFEPLTIPAGASDAALTVHATADAAFARVDVAIKAVSSGMEATASASVSIVGLAGNIDTTFGRVGEVELAASRTGFVLLDALRSGEQHIVASPGRLVRLSSAGEIDDRFGAGGSFEVSAHTVGLTSATIAAVSATSSNRFLLAGHGPRINEVDQGVFVVAVTSAGQPDPARPGAELFADEATDERVVAAAAAPDESLYLLISQSPQGGREAQTFVVRARTDGQLDGAFGRVVVTGGRRLVALANGDVVLFGGTQITHITSAGALSTSFGVGGTVSLAGYSQIHDVTPLPDGRLVVTGTDAYFMQLTRLLDTGRLDESFGEQGTLKYAAATEFQEYGVRLWIAPDGSGYGAGYTDEYSPYLNRLRFFRVSAAGAIDTGYGANGATIDAFRWDEIVAVTFGDDHRVVVTGLSYEEQDSRPVARRYWY
jgi:uncharacterized delta-60 repeat protein